MSGKEVTYYNPKMESLLNTPEMADVQLAKIKKQVKYVYENSTYHKQAFDEAGVKPEDIKSIQDFRERIPLFDKEKHQQCQADSKVRDGHMFGTHLCANVEDVRLVASTSGTTGEPTFYTMTQNDLNIVYECVGRGIHRMGISPGDRVLHAFALGMFGAGVPVVQALENYGAMAVPAGMASGTEKVAKMALATGASAILSTPSFIEHTIERLKNVMGIDVSSLGINTIMAAGEPGAGVPEVRNKIESAFQARLYDFIGVVWGAMGCSCDAEEYQGMHMVADDHNFLELIDPDTGELLPIEDGVVGSSVITALDWQGGPPIRYSMGDMMQVTTSPCPCGRSGYRIRVVGRSDDMLKVKGVIVYPAGVRSVLQAFEPRITREFRIILDTPPPRVIPPLKLRLEKGEHTTDEELPKLTEEIRSAMHSKMQFTPEIIFEEYMSIPRSEHKTDYFEKTYK